MTNKEWDHLYEHKLVEVQLTIKEYKILRQLIEERQTMSGLKLWLNARVMWFAGGLLTFLGIFEYVRRFGMGE